MDNTQNVSGEKSEVKPTAERGRTHPLPLADRRRLLRPAVKSESDNPVFTDWASI